MVFHNKKDILVTLIDIVLVPNVSFNLFSFHFKDQPAVIGRTGTYALGGRLIFSHGTYGS